MFSIHPNSLIALLGVVCLLLGTAPCDDISMDASADAESLALSSKKDKDDDKSGGGRIPFDDAEVFFEFNTTDDDLGMEYKIEILAYHENGNRTIAESTFVTGL